MSVILYSFLFFIISLSSYGATWKKIASSAVVQSCPDGYILVPATSPYTTRDFCVMKYEAKDDSYGTPVSKPLGTPWANIDRAGARAKCQSLGYGYDLISNDQWQTIARNIAGVANNWIYGSAGFGEVNRGHSDSAPNAVLAASANDNDPCVGTGQTCSATVWHNQRRTHDLSNGNKIWDFSGNIWEWVLVDNKTVVGADSFVSLVTVQDVRQTKYGYPLTCPSYSTTPYCGFGYGYYNYSAGGLFRGGAFNLGINAGIYASNFYYDVTFTAADVGFRCIYTP